VSADNWDFCPRCKLVADEKLAAAREKLNEHYGVIPVEKYLREMADVKRQEKAVPEQTFREDYQIGIYDGYFHVSYCGLCIKCNFEFRFNKEQRIDENQRRNG
jgi:hypothetical protein